MEENIKKRGNNLWIKLLIIFIISLFLLIPQAIVQDMVGERNSTKDEAMEEVTQKWGGSQMLYGPVLMVPGLHDAKQRVYIMPEVFDAKARLNTQLLNRGIFDISVYDAQVGLGGTFVLPKELDGTKRKQLDFANAQILFAFRNYRSFADYPTFTLDGQKVELNAAGKSLSNRPTLMCRVDMSRLLAGGKAEFCLDAKLKGSGSFDLVPMGRISSVEIASNCATPSFVGYLPVERSVSDTGFVANWKVLSINREFSQVESQQPRYEDVSKVMVDLRVPVDQYQKTTRTSKYAYLIILLTFAVVFLIEQRRGTPVHPVQYGLVGVALVLFYTLLLAFTEHIAFGWSYFIASVMTVGLIAAFIGLLTKHRGAMLAVGGLLAALYAFVFMLMLMETYALLVGSIGVFVVLALAMYASQKIKWY